MSDTNKTKVYGDNKSDKTGIYNAEQSKENKTGIYSNNQSDKTGVYSSESDTAGKYNQGICVGDELTIREKRFRVIDIISEGTGEANVYKLEDTGKKLFALKLYYEFNHASEEPNGVALSRIQKLDDPDILKLIDYGVGADKYLGKFCYEISDFALGGNLFDVDDFEKKYSPDFVEKEVIPQIYLALTKLHQFKIFHCDLKPGNILYKDTEQNDIVIGDYGSAKAYDLESEKSIRKSSTVKGTEFYLPPEQARGIVSEKNDYYSFGMVLLHLIYPHSITGGSDFKKVDSDKFEQIVERQYSQKPIVDFNPAYRRLNNLIEGLTLLNHINRWGPNEVERWLNGENIEISYFTQKASDVKPLKIGPVEIADAVAFVRYLDTKASWFEDLFEDEDVFKIIKDWLDNYIGIPDRKRFEKMVSLYRPSGKLVLKEAVCLFLTPNRTLHIENEQYDFFNNKNINLVVTNYIHKIDTVYKLITTDELSMHLFRLEFILKTLYYQVNDNQAVKAILAKLYGPADTPLQLPEQFDYNCPLHKLFHKSVGEEKIYPVFISIAHAFNPDRPYPDNNNQALKNIEDLAVFYIQKPEIYEDKYHRFERTALLKKLNHEKAIGLNMKDFCSELLSKYAELQLKLDYISFDKICNVHYSLCWVLEAFLKSRNINVPYILKDESGFIYAEKNVGLTASAVKMFSDYLKKEHAGSRFTEASLAEIETRFTQAHRKYFRLNNIISVVSIILIIGLVVAIIYKLTV